MRVFRRSSHANGGAAAGAKACWPAPNKSACSFLYLKVSPAFDVLAATFGLPRSKACEHTHRLAKALERTLRTQGVLPARAIGSLAQV